MSYIDAMFLDLENRIRALREAQQRQLAQLDVVGAAYSFPVSTLADAPLSADGQITYAVRFISDARKSGETTGNGTGLPAFYDPDSDSWLDFTGAAIVT